MLPCSSLSLAWSTSSAQHGRLQSTQRIQGLRLDLTIKFKAIVYLEIMYYLECSDVFESLESPVDTAIHKERDGVRSMSVHDLAAVGRSRSFK